MKRIESLENIARETVGDGKSPNLFFVSVEGNIGMITQDFLAAYRYWRDLPRNIETALEDRKTGTICDTTPIEDGSAILRTYDDAPRKIRLAA